MKTAIITGVTGQDGAYLSKQLLDKDYVVVGVVRDKYQINTRSLQYLGIANEIVFEEVNLSVPEQVIQLMIKHKPQVVYNLAAQSSVSLSFKEPKETLSFNIISVLNILEAIRQVDDSIRFYQASSSEMYGKVSNLPISEQTVMHPLSPYAISKASAHWIAVNYREAYGLFTCCGVLFNHDSYLRTSTFFTKKVLQSAIAIKKGHQDILEVGNIEVKRDFGYAPKYTEAMVLMMEKDVPDDYLICSGTSIYLREIIEYVFKSLDISMDKVRVNPDFYRPADIENIYGVSFKAKAQLGWDYSMSYFDVLDILIAEELENYKK
ncbi:MAG: GDP-mannose 4,6-dehydratase [Bacteroidetes bacterium]|jgi:GDPmannose 4,6-dehydratase|nr:GDP-mannose 4,6-dehydratase [Bacteroidota bacterium]